MKYKIGNFLFKLRSFTPLPLLLAIVFFKPHKTGDFDWLIIVISIVLIILGELIRILVVGYSAEGTSGREVYLRADAINTSGIYSLIRNPLYVGNLIIYNGLLFIIFSPLLFLIMNIFFIVQYHFIILSEERYLENKYGKTYLDYKKSTGKIIPDFKNYRPAKGKFKSRKVLYKEVDSVFNIMVLFTLFLVYRIIHLRGAVRDPLWFYSFGGVVILVYIILRFKKRQYKKDNLS